MTAIDDQRYRPVPNRGDHRCFACGPQNPVGLHMRFCADETTVISRVTVGAHLCGWDNLVHGGVVSTLLDEIMSWTAIRFLKRFILTKSMRVDFVRPVYTGSELTIKGRIGAVRRNREATILGRLYNDRKQLCARSEGIYVLLTTEVARRKSIMSEKALAGFMQILDAQK